MTCPSRVFSMKRYLETWSRYRPRARDLFLEAWWLVENKKRRKRHRSCTFDLFQCFSRWSSLCCIIQSIQHSWLLLLHACVPALAHTGSSILLSQQSYWSVVKNTIVTSAAVSALGCWLFFESRTHEFFSCPNFHHHPYEQFQYDYC